MYKIISDSSILRLTDGAFIPTDPRNGDYIEYLGWLNAGNSPLPADPVVPAVPFSVPMWAARAVLVDQDMLDDVYAFIEAISDEKVRKKALSKFEYSSTVQRSDELLAAYAQAKGLTSQQVDALFVAAADIALEN